LSGADSSLAQWCAAQIDQDQIGSDHAPDWSAGDLGATLAAILFSLPQRQRSIAKKYADGGRAMRFGAGIGSIMFVAVLEAASAQPFPDPSTLDATQLRGRDLFNQSCLVCHLKLQITSAAKYGPDLSKEALGGQETVMRDVISNGTPNMPGFKYTYAPAQIDSIIAYVKTLPTPAKPNPTR
jgi:mono/diheme cytochrome c family protein